MARKKYFVLVQIEQYISCTHLLYRHDIPNKPSKKGPLSFVLFESPFHLGLHSYQRGQPLYSLVGAAFTCSDSLPATGLKWTLTTCVKTHVGTCLGWTWRLAGGTMDLSLDMSFLQDSEPSFLALLSIFYSDTRYRWNMRQYVFGLPRRLHPYQCTHLGGGGRGGGGGGKSGIRKTMTWAAAPEQAFRHPDRTWRGGGWISMFL